MPELKKEIKDLSEWVKFELETDMIDPPEISLRISPIYPIDSFDGFDEEGNFKFKQYYVQAILDAVKEWDVKRHGKEVVLDEEAKRKHLWPLLNAKIKDKRSILGHEIYSFATNSKNFLKN